MWQRSKYGPLLSTASYLFEGDAFTIEYNVLVVVSTGES